MLEELQNNLKRAQRSEEVARKNTLHRCRYTQDDRDTIWMDRAEETLIAQRELNNYKKEQGL